MKHIITILAIAFACISLSSNVYGQNSDEDYIDEILDVTDYSYNSYQKVTLPIVEMLVPPVGKYTADPGSLIEIEYRPTAYGDVNLTIWLINPDGEKKCMTTKSDRIITFRKFKCKKGDNTFNTYMILNRYDEVVIDFLLLDNGYVMYLPENTKGLGK